MSVGRLFVNRAKGSGYHLLVVALVAILVLVSSLWRVQELMNTRGTTEFSGTNKTVVVTKGDTLWQLARKYGPAGVDTRKVIANIKQMNDLSDAQITPGMVLRIPE